MRYGFFLNVEVRTVIHSNNFDNWSLVESFLTGNHTTSSCKVAMNGFVSMYDSVCFCCTSVLLLFLYFPLLIDVFPSILVFNPDLFSLNKLMAFEHRYTVVAFICLIHVNQLFKTITSSHSWNRV